MERHLDVELTELKEHLIRMAGHVEGMIARAIEALAGSDSDLARDTNNRDTLVDEIEIEIEERGTELLALYQPVAGDLRLVTACMMIAKDLERMGDLAANICLYVIRLNDMEGPAFKLDVQPMARVVQRMVRDAINAIVHGDVELARAVCSRDDEVDNFNDQFAREIKEAMTRDPANVEPGISMLLIVRALERIADHATNIGEDVVHYIEGETIRHRPHAVQKKTA